MSEYTLIGPIEYRSRDGHAKRKWLLRKQGAYRISLIAKEETVRGDGGALYYYGRGTTQYLNVWTTLDGLIQQYLTLKKATLSPETISGEEYEKGHKSKAHLEVVPDLDDAGDDAGDDYVEDAD
jgi:hypothetical protein